jgi:hypothetical protein
MDLLVKPNQSAFIKQNRNIQDNFRMVRGAAKILHVRKRASVLSQYTLTAVDQSGALTLLCIILCTVNRPGTSLLLL